MKSIGGRYSALSNFGMVPAAVMGLDVDELLDEAERMLHACAPGVPANENPGLVLGTILGVAATQGVDKLTLIASPGIYDLGAWLEQLIAESTGKQGKGIIPVDREAVGAPAVYGDDRVFAYLRLEDAPDAAQDAAVAALEKAGKPVVTIRVATQVRPRRGVRPLGDRHRHRRRGDRHQSVQSARRRGQQDRDEVADQRIREDREAAVRSPVLRGRRGEALRRREERRRR